jgi:hypothetical protein
VSGSTSPPPGTIRVRTTTSWPASTASTTWGIQSAPRSTSCPPWPLTARG